MPRFYWRVRVTLAVIRADLGYMLDNVRRTWEFTK